MSDDNDDNLQDSSLDLQTQESSIFSDFVTVISGARQSANQEFGRFWEKFGFSKNNDTLVSTQTRQTTQTRPSNNNSNMIPPQKQQQQHREQKFVSTSFQNKNDIARMRAGKNIYGRIIPDNNRRGYIRDAEIQTDNVLEDETLDPSFTSSQPPSPDVKKGDGKAHYPFKRRSSLITKDLHDLLFRPTKIVKRDTAPSTSLFPAPLQSITSFLSKPAKHTAEDEDLEPADIRVAKVLKQSPPTKRIIPSPLNSMPVQSSPERKNDIITGSAKSVRRLTFELEEQFSPRLPASFTSPTKKSINSSSSTSSSNNDSDPFHSTPLVKDRNDQQQHLAPNKKRLTQEEEDERMEQLEKKVGTIQSQMSDFASYPSNIKSPTPSHAVISIEEIRLKTNTIPRSPIKNINSSSNPSSTTTPSSHTNHVNHGYSSPSRIPPPAPPAPAVNAARNTFSPIRDIPFGYQNLSTTSNIRERSLTPIQRSPIVKDEKKKSPLKPNDKHKSKMRELIQLIPGVKLRKTDTIIGPDGIERPNPFWNEIYNPSGRRVL